MPLNHRHCLIVGAGEGDVIEVKVALGMKRSPSGYLLLQPERDGPKFLPK